MTTAEGVRAIAAAAAEAAPSAAEQLELLERLAPTRFTPGSVQHDEQRARLRAAGRPIGAKNLAQKAAVELVRRLFGDPMVERARWLLHSPESLATELGCTKLEAFDRQDKIRADLMRFVYAPLAATDGQGNAVAPVLQMFVGGRAAGADGRPPWDYDGGPTLDQAVEKPSVSDAPGDVSYGGPSYEEDK